MFTATRPSVTPLRLRSRRTTLRPCAAAKTVVALESATSSVQGTSRRQNEDRHTKQSDAPAKGASYWAVFDGHGGAATAEWLVKELIGHISSKWNASGPEGALKAAFIEADERILAPGEGFFGQFKERGVGGSKCGATAVTAIVYEEGGERKLAVANLGDARAVLSRGGEAVQLSIDHVPDTESERIRIESSNPNPKLPLVKFVAGTWRVAGLLALSRAFGDAFLKSSGDFEGVDYRDADYSSGFGVISEPDVFIETLTDKDEYLLLCSDGLNTNEERGGGGGLENDEVIELIKKAGPNPDLAALSKDLCLKAQTAGSTDDVTVTLIKLK